MASSNVDKANLLNEIFSPCSNQVLSKLDLDKLPVDPSKCPVDLLCYVDAVVEREHLSSLDNAKASGPDNILARMQIATDCSIAPLVMKMFNICIRNGTLPIMWKSTNVVLILKGKEMDQVRNYRPISLLSIPSKVLESHMANSIRKHLLIANVNQWSCRKGDQPPLPFFVLYIHQ